MPDPTARVSCPVCGRSTRRHPSGLVRLHDRPDRQGERCPGAGRTVNAAAQKVEADA